MSNSERNSIPEISVILAVYNGEQYLEESIRSIQKQTFKNWELILINDGSTDRSGLILEKLASEDRKLHIITQHNQGLTKSLNRGLEKARGRYIARLDTGDIAEEKRLEKQKEFLDSHPDHVAVGGYVLFMTPEGLPVYNYTPSLNHDEIDANQIIGDSGQIAHPALMMRKTAVSEINGYCEDFLLAQDTDLLLRLAEIGRLANLNKQVVSMRLGQNSLSSKKRDQQFSFANEALKRARLRRGLSPLDPMPVRWVPKSEYDLLISWVKKAIVANNYNTSRKYAWKCMLMKPSFIAGKLWLYSVMKMWRRSFDFYGPIKKDI